MLLTIINVIFFSIFFFFFSLKSPLYATQITRINILICVSQFSLHNYPDYRSELRNHAPTGCWPDWLAIIYIKMPINITDMVVVINIIDISSPKGQHQHVVTIDIDMDIVKNHRHSIIVRVCVWTTMSVMVHWRWILAAKIYCNTAPVFVCSNLIVPRWHQQRLSEHLIKSYFYSFDRTSCDRKMVWYLCQHALPKLLCPKWPLMCNLILNYNFTSNFAFEYVWVRRWWRTIEIAWMCVNGYCYNAPPKICWIIPSLFYGILCKTGMNDSINCLSNYWIEHTNFGCF